MDDREVMRRLFIYVGRVACRRVLHRIHKPFSMFFEFFSFFLPPSIMLCYSTIICFV